MTTLADQMSLGAHLGWDSSWGGTQLGQEKGRNFESAPEPGKKLTNYSAAKKLGQKITQLQKHWDK